MQRISGKTAIFILLATIPPILAMLGWLFNISVLKSVVPSWTPMNPFTAVSFLVLGFATLTYNLPTAKHLSLILSSGILVTSCWIICAWIYGFPLRPDAWLFAEKLGLELKPNRMAPNTAVAFILISLSHLLFWRNSQKTIRLAQGLAFCAGLVGAITLFGYILSIGVLGTVGNTLPMAISTGACFLFLTCGAFSIRPGAGFSLPFNGNSSTAVIARQLLLAGLFVPILVTTMQIYGERAGLFSHEVGSATGALITVLAFALLLWRCVSELRASEDARDEMNEGLKLRASELESARAMADRANQAKSEFLSRMSHELRTPLNAVIGYAQLLEMKSPEPHILKSTQAILKGGRHLLQLINEVLDLAKIEAGKLTLSSEPVSLTNAINQAIELVLPTAGSKEVIFDTTVLPADDIYVLADRQRLIQVLLNILSNAVKYNRTGGHVTISVVETGNSTLRIDIADTGMGLSENSVDMLFKPFERLGDETVEGTGLGLALSQNLMNLMGGKILLSETSSKGSVFSIELNQAQAPSAVLSPINNSKGSDVSGIETLRVIYIEDNLSNLQLLESIFSHYGGVEMLSAMQASVGMDLVRDHVPDLVLLDLHLPGVSGLDLLKELKNSPELAEIPVVVLSADATERQISRALSAGAKSYLTKPIDIPTLLAELDEIRTNTRRAA